MKWEDIKGYTGLYKINNVGQIMDCTTGSFTPTRINRGGYVAVALSNLNKKQKVFLVHRLVAETFIENPLNKPQIHHIDENTTNNNVNNLMWVTAQEHGKLRSKQSKDNFRKTYRENLLKRKSKNYKEDMK